jgi:hypothetical protein
MPFRQLLPLQQQMLSGQQQGQAAQQTHQLGLPLQQLLVLLLLKKQQQIRSLHQQWRALLVCTS